MTADCGVVRIKVVRITAQVSPLWLISKLSSAWCRQKAGGRLTAEVVSLKISETRVEAMTLYG